VYTAVERALCTLAAASASFVRRAAEGGGGERAPPARRRPLGQRPRPSALTQAGLALREGLLAFFLGEEGAPSVAARASGRWDVRVRNHQTDQLKWQ